MHLALVLKGKKKCANALLQRWYAQR